MDQRASAHLSGHLIKSFDSHKDMAAQQQAQAQAQARAAFTPKYIMQPADTQAMSYTAQPSQHFGGQHGYAPSQFMELSEQSGRMIATMQRRLSQKLGPEYITQRPGPGGGPKLSYIEGWKVINLANEIFGFNGWSSQIISLTVDFCDPHGDPSSNRWNVGVSALVRITLRDGVYHEDIGYGQTDNAKGKGAALDKAKKEAVTDGVKRSLRSFGNVLGNCLYDKEYGKAITQMKVEPVKFNPSTLYRRPEFDPDFQNSSVASTSKPHPMESNDYNCPPKAPPNKIYQHQPAYHPPPPATVPPVASSSRLPSAAPANNTPAAREHHAQSLAYGQGLARSDTTAMWAGMPDLGNVVLPDVGARRAGESGYGEKDSGVDVDMMAEGEGEFDGGFTDAAFCEEDLLLVESQAEEARKANEASMRTNMLPPPVPNKPYPSNQHPNTATSHPQPQNNLDQQLQTLADRTSERSGMKVEETGQNQRARSVGGFSFPPGHPSYAAPTSRSEVQQPQNPPYNRANTASTSSTSSNGRSSTTAATLRAEAIRASMGGPVPDPTFGENRAPAPTGVHEMDRIAAKANTNARARQFGEEFDVGLGGGEHGMPGLGGERAVGFTSARGMKRGSPGEFGGAHGSPGDGFGRPSSGNLGGAGRRVLGELSPTDLHDAKRARA